jgi:hypothetical protein
MVEDNLVSFISNSFSCSIHQNIYSCHYHSCDTSHSSKFTPSSDGVACIQSEMISSSLISTSPRLDSGNSRRTDMETSGDNGGGDNGEDNGDDGGVIVVGLCEGMDGGVDGRIWAVPKYRSFKIFTVSERNVLVT